MAISKFLVKIPVTPNSYKGLSKTISPVDFIGTSTDSYPNSANSARTLFACQSANLLSRVPILIIFCMEY